MIVLDENIDEPQRRRLEMWRVRVRQIGVEVGRLGMKDRNEIIPLLHGLRRSTFFTRDRDFYEPGLRAFLRRQGFRTHAERLGKVVGAFIKLELPIGKLVPVSQKGRAGESGIIA